jgi:hypothetical protein
MYVRFGIELNARGFFEGTIPALAQTKESHRKFCSE